MSEQKTTESNRSTIWVIEYKSNKTECPVTKEPIDIPEWTKANLPRDKAIDDDQANLNASKEETEAQAEELCKEFGPHGFEYRAVLYARVEPENEE